MEKTTKLIVGSPAPEFSLPDESGYTHTLKDQGGRWVLLYFYPKDDTPGCTKEACMIRDSFPHFKKLNITVFGVSADSEKSHKKFKEKYDLPFTLLSDENKDVIRTYGVWGEKSFMGKKFQGILRTSFLIDPTGRIAKIYEKVKPAEHADEVLHDIKILAAKTHSH
ncbi:MAG: thioredoxin-dependent thiol peroxidase [Patescibacteria group bacterium]